MTTALGLKMQEAIEAAEARKAMAEWTTKPISLSETTFNMVRDNPGTTKGRVITLLEKDGHKAVSTTSLLSAMLRYGILTQNENKTLYAVGDTYKSRVEFNKQLAKKRKVVRMIKKGTPEVEPPAKNSIDAIIDSLSLHSAIELRNRLNKLFAEEA
jgi:hypothetical protein